MNSTRAITSLLIPLLIFVTVLIIIYPWYQYYVDDDAIAYITISKKYAAGDIDRAVNGLWSPWCCWLTALLINQGVEAFKAGIIINTIGAGCFLIASHFLFTRFITKQVVILALNTTLGIFLVYAVFKQSFADLWSFFFLLVAVQIMLKEKFLDRPVLWLLFGLIGAFAYVAKAYAFPYLILITIVGVALLLKQKPQPFDYKKWLKISLIVIGTLIIFSIPWIWMLHEKYGKWMTSTAGYLNLSWFLIGHPYYKEGIELLLPPVYPDAIYFWEDPYLINGDAPHFWDSPSLFILQIVRVGYNSLKLMNSINEISCFFLPVILLAICIVCIRKVRSFFPPKIGLVSVIFLLFPTGYMLINFEARYLWFLVPISLLLVGVLWEKTTSYVSNKALHLLLLLVFCFSYLAFPVWDMKMLYKEGEAEYKLSQDLSRANIKGTFASNIVWGKEISKAVKVAYFSNNSYYYMPLPPKNTDQLLNELKHYKIKYYFQFQNPFELESSEFKDANGNPYPLVFKDSSDIGLKVYQVN